MAINIPKSIRKDITLLASLSPETFAEVEAALQAMPILINPQDLDAYCTTSTTTKPRELHEIARAGISLAGGRLSTDLDIPQFVAEVVAASADWEEFGDKPELQKTLAERVGILLSIDSVSMGAKAAIILHETPRHVIGTRILTDVRPIFGEGEITAPITSLIAHTLRIEYHEGGEIKSFFASLDRADIDKLKAQSDRALAKEVALKSTLGSAGINYTDSVPTLRKNS